MNRKTMLIIAVAALAVAPLAGALPTYLAPGNPNCQPNDEIHSFAPFAGFMANSKSATTGTFGVSGMWGGPNGGDGNLQDCGSGFAADYDGDTEFGWGGNFFPAGNYADDCGTATQAGGIDWVGGTSVHHDAGAGKEYWAHNTIESGVDLFFSAGTDGPTVGNLPCQTNNIVSDDPITDPWDCPGDTAGRHAGGPTIPNFGVNPGVSTIGAGSHAFAHDGTIGPNAWSYNDPNNVTADAHDAIHGGTALGIIASDACQPWDGFVLVFYTPGVFEDVTDPLNPKVYVSYPVMGDAGEN